MIQDINAANPPGSEAIKQENKIKIHVCFSSDKIYAKFLSLAIVSLLSNKQKNDYLCIYVMDGGLSEDDKEKLSALKSIADFDLKFINIDSKRFKSCPVKNSKYITLAAYYRLLISDFFPELDKIIYLDCDVLVKDSLKDFYETSVDGYYFAAVQDVDAQRILERLPLKEYYNSGVLLLNLEKFRQEKFTEKVFEWIEENRSLLQLHDQDVLNLYCNGFIKQLPAIWNAQQKYHKKVDGAVVMHYVGRFKDDFIFAGMREAFKTGYSIELSKALVKRFFCRIFKTTFQWIFRLKNKNDTQKELTVLGMKFYMKRKSLKI